MSSVVYWKSWTGLKLRNRPDGLMCELKYRLNVEINTFLSELWTQHPAVRRNCWKRSLMETIEEETGVFEVSTGGETGGRGKTQRQLIVKNLYLQITETLLIVSFLSAEWSFWWWWWRRASVCSNRTERQWTQQSHKHTHTVAIATDGSENSGRVPVLS